MKFDPTTNRRWIRITPGSKLERGLLRNWQKYPRDIDKSKKKAKKKKKKKKDEKLFNKNSFKKFACTPKKIFYKSCEIGFSSSFSLDFLD